MKLTVRDVERIKIMLGSGEYTQPQIARMFDVSVETIHKISSGSTWKFVKGPPTKNRARQPLSEDKVALLEKMWKDGYSALDISRVLRCTKVTVYRYLKKLKLKE